MCQKLDFQVGLCCNFVMTQKKQVSIKDPNAISEHHFPFNVGDELKIDEDADTGVVEDAIWEGGEAHHFTMTYHIRTADGSLRILDLTDVLALNPERE